MASTTQASAEAARRVRARVDALETKVASSCAGEPADMGPFVDAVAVATEANLSESGVRRVLNAYSAWALAVDARDNLEGVVDDLAFCNRFEDEVRAGYAVWWEPAAYGKRSWVQITVDNDTSARYWLDLGGELWATGLRPDLARGHPRDPHRGGRQWVWGGSSADSMYALPGTRSSRTVGVGEFYYLYMKSDGQVYDVRPDITVRAEGHTCSLPVPRTN